MTRVSYSVVLGLVLVSTVLAAIMESWNRRGKKHWARQDHCRAQCCFSLAFFTRTAFQSAPRLQTAALPAPMNRSRTSGCPGASRSCTGFGALAARVGLADHLAHRHASAAGKEGEPGLSPVIAAGGGVDLGGAAHLAPHEHGHVLVQPALLQIGHGRKSNLQ